MKVFISHYPEDFLKGNQERSWVHVFQQDLAKLARQFGEHEITTTSNPEEAQAFIVIVSENYSKYSEALTEFKAGQHADSRLQTLVVTTIDTSKRTIPEWLKSFPVFEFFEYDADADLVETYENYHRKTQGYWQQLDDIVCQLLGLFHLPTNHQTVYLGATSIDLKSKREVLRRSLLHQGFRVIPEVPFLEKSEEDLITQISTALAASDYFIHLAGGFFGELVNEKEDSLMSLENELSQQVAVEELKCFIWIPKPLEIHEARQQAYIEYLRAHREVKGNLLFMETSFERFQNELYESLSTINTPILNATQLGVLYETDSPLVASTQKYLSNNATNIIDLTTIRQWKHLQSLFATVSHIIYIIEDFSSDWAKTWLFNAQKSLGYRTSNNPIQHILISNSLPDKQNFSMFKVINTAEVEEKLPKLLFDN